MRRAAAFAAALAGLSFPPALASADRIVVQPRENGVTADVEQAADDLQNGRYEPALDRLDRSLATAANPREIVLLQLFRGLALTALDRSRDALAAFDASRAALPDEATPSLMQYELGWRVAQPHLALDALDHLIADFPEAALGLDQGQIMRLLAWQRDKDAGRADDFTVGLARIGFGGEDIQTRSFLALTAIETLLDDERVDEARSLVPAIADREALAQALTLRSYSVLWPDLAAHAGPNMAAANATALESAEGWLAREPDNVRARWNAVRTYRLANRNGDADAVAAPFALDQSAIPMIDEAGAWLINEHAFALHALGRPDDADLRFAQLRAIDIESADWLISMVINRLALRVRDGRWTEAAALGPEAATLAETYGSPYARQLVRKLRACTLDGLGRTAELEPLVVELVAHDQDSRVNSIDALICLGRLDDAEALVIAGLAEGDGDSLIVGQLQSDRVDGGRPPGIWDGGWRRLRARPAVAAAFDAVARDLPESLRPPPAAPLASGASAPISGDPGGGGGDSHKGTEPRGRDYDSATAGPSTPGV